VFLIRQSKPEDVSTLVKLARTVYFINLPPDERIIANKIEHSTRCVRGLLGLDEPKGPAKPRKKPTLTLASSSKGLASRESESESYMFSIIEPESGAVVGTSQARAHMGGPGNPNWRMRVSEKKFFAPSLRFGTTHTVAQLDGDETGPTELGGLILDPGFRGHPLRPGRFLSFVRFHFMGLYRDRFADTVLAEMMGPVNGDGDSVFWDAFGRKFIPVKFAEADRFCQHNRAFISELLPKEEVYLSLFPLEVQNLVGAVSRETIPARRLLESLGFATRGFVDPFDGGPHLDAPTDSIPLVKQTRRIAAIASSQPKKCTIAAMLSTLTPEGEFRAVESWIEPIGKTSTNVRILPQAAEVLGIDGPSGGLVGLTPLGKHGPPTSDAPHLLGDSQSRGNPAGSHRSVPSSAGRRRKSAGTKGRGR
jgi:arginine N-succinyltransferase